MRASHVAQELERVSDHTLKLLVMYLTRRVMYRLEVRRVTYNEGPSCDIRRALSVEAMQGVAADIVQHIRESRRTL